MCVFIYIYKILGPASQIVLELSGKKGEIKHKLQLNSRQEEKQADIAV